MKHIVFNSLDESIAFESTDFLILRYKIFKNKVFKLIGKGGCNIKAIQSKTSTRIKINDNKYDELLDYAEMVIEGSGSSVRDAIFNHLISFIISEKLEDNPKFTDNSYNNRNSSQLIKNCSTAKTIDWKKLYEENDKAEVKRWEGSAPIIKNFYVESLIISNLSISEVETLRLKLNKITITCEPSVKIPNPIETFEQAFLCEKRIIEVLNRFKYTKPSPIQSQSWPVILSGYDLIGIAQTGTGKTLAFLLPAFVHIIGQQTPRNCRKGPTVLIMAPTRELAIQINEEVKKFTLDNIKSVVIYGGTNIADQIKSINGYVDIVVATPGRLIDLVSSGILSLVSVSYLVLDEADRMLDMGFEPDIRKIILDIRPDRHTIMTSATWPLGVQMMADRYCTNPIKINVGSMDLAACHSIVQNIEIIEPDSKDDRIFNFIETMDPTDKVLIFVGKKIVADQLSCNLSLSHLSHIGIQCIHGSREQSDREQAIDDFKKGSARILIATDVASRGLDICDITHVINYDFPKTIDEYVHRIGRTGRAGRTGISLTLMTKYDWSHSKELIKIMENANQIVPSQLRDMATRYALKMEENNGKPIKKPFERRSQINDYF